MRDDSISTALGPRIITLELVVLTCGFSQDWSTYSLSVARSLALSLDASSVSVSVIVSVSVSVSPSLPICPSVCVCVVQPIT